MRPILVSSVLSYIVYKEVYSDLLPKLLQAIILFPFTVGNKLERSYLFIHVLITDK